MGKPCGNLFPIIILKIIAINRNSSEFCVIQAVENIYTQAYHENYKKLEVPVITMMASYAGGNTLLSRYSRSNKSRSSDLVRDGGHARRSRHQGWTLFGHPEELLQSQGLVVQL